MLAPEDQHILYLAVRDGDISTIESFINQIGIDCQPFEALWHEPGPEATCLHLAVCCCQYETVKYLLSKNANIDLKANGKTALEMIESYDLFEPTRVQNPENVDRIKKLLIAHNH